MAETTRQIQKLLADLVVTQYDHDPDGTSATDVAWVSMADASSIAFGIFRTVGTGALTITILANPESDGSGNDVTVKTWTPAAAPDATGDHVWYEIDTEDILAAAGAGHEYVSLNITQATAGDEAVVTYIRKSKHAQLDNTADVVA